MAAREKKRKRDVARARPAAGAPAAADPGRDRAPGITRLEVEALLAGVEAFDRKLESSRKVLEDLAAQLGALARLSFNFGGGGAERVVPRLVEMHNSLSNVHSSLEDSFEGVRTRYAELRERSAAITSGRSLELEASRKLLDELGRRMEGAAGRPDELLKCLKEENLLFSAALDSYNAVLSAVATMREVEAKVHEVFNEFSETIGRIDGISRTMGEFISHEETRAFEEELDFLRKWREERVGRYIR